jgi:C1A family cysteine protease
MAAKEMDEFTSYPTTFAELDGTSLKAALDIARKFGVVTNDILPFRVPDSSGALTNESLYRKGPIQTLLAEASKLKIASYYNLATNQATKLATWKNWLAANNGPILTALGVDATWDNATNTHGNLDVYQPNTVRGGHCVAIVGYIQDRFIIRNSWGTAWGDKGFAYASNAYAQAAFNEAYGVSV